MSNLLFIFHFVICFIYQCNSSKINILSNNNPNSWKRTKCGFNGSDIITKWGQQTDPSNTSTLLPEYPRPQLTRDVNNSYVNMNGLWEFQVAANNNSILNPPFNKTLNRTILVPFPVESCLSGIGKNYQYLWYRIVFSINTSWFDINNKKEKMLLNFGAVDWTTNVFMNGKNIAKHIGAYDTFIIDLTSYLKQNYNEILLFVYDPSNLGLQPNGKQNIGRINNPSGDQFTPSSGIWQTVWIEKVNENYISSLRISTDLKYINLTVISLNNDGNGNNVDVKIMDPIDNSVIFTTTTVINKTVNISIPNPKLWAPSTPNLYKIELSYDGDIVQSYAGMRSISLKATLKRPFIVDTGMEQSIGRMNGGGNIINGYPISIDNVQDCWLKCNQTNNCLSWNYQCKNGNGHSNMCYLYSNNIASSNLTFNHCLSSGEKNVSEQYVAVPHLNDKPIYFAGWLDQSFYPDGLYSPPSNEILYFDISAVKEFGFNTARVHEKVQPELYYYYADLLGVLIWQDMPQKYGNAKNGTIPYFIDDLTRMVQQKFNHPSIIQWEIFNENDCVGAFEPYKNNIYNVSITDMYNLVKSLDDTRLINIDSGGMATSSHIGDVFDVHDYPNIVHVESSLTQYGAQAEYGSCAAGGYVNHEWKVNGCETFYNCGGTINNPKVTPQIVVDFYGKQVDYILSDLIKYDIHGTIFVEIADIETECHGFHTYDRINKYNETQVKQLKALNQKLINSQSKYISINEFNDAS